MNVIGGIAEQEKRRPHARIRARNFTVGRMECGPSPIIRSLGDPTREGRADQTRGHAVDANALVGQLGGEATDHHFESAFGRIIKRGVSLCESTVGRTDDYHPPRDFLYQPVPYKMLNREVRRCQIQLKHLVILFECHVYYRTIVDAPASACYQHIDPRLQHQGLRDESRYDLRKVSIEISRQMAGTHPVSPAICEDWLGIRFVATVNDDVCSGSSAALSQGGANATSAAGH